MTLPDVPSFFRPKVDGAPVIARRYHFSLAGLAYALTTAVLVIGAINGQNNLLFWLFGLAVAGLVVSGILSGWSLMGIRIQRDILTPQLHAGETLRIRYRITNRNYIFPAFAMTIEEMPQARSWLGKLFAASFTSHARTPVAYIGYIGPRQTVTVETTAPAHTRGVCTFNALRIASTFPIGLTRKSVTFAQQAAFTVWPAKFTLAKSFTREGLEGRSTQRLRPSPSGDEFFALREFQPGDSTRSVAWRATARAERPLVRSMAVRPGRRIWLTIDDRATGDDLERIAAFAGSLAANLLQSGSEVGLATVAQGALLTPTAGDRNRVRILNALATITTAQCDNAPVRTHTGDTSMFIHAGTSAPPSAGRTLPIDVRSPQHYHPAQLPDLPTADGDTA